jgi:acetyl esterase/lipase
MASNIPPLTLDPSLFDPASVTEESKAYDAAFVAAASSVPQIADVGIPEYRRLRASGQTHIPPVVPLPSAVELLIPSREAGRALPCHVLRPQDGRAPRSSFMHIHGGGFAFGDHISADRQLQDLADEHGIACVSVGYRLTPEHPFPAGIEDCWDAAEWLASGGAERELGAPLEFIGGESAGAYMSVQVALHLLRHPEPRFADVRIKGLVLHYGCYSLLPLPSVVNLGQKSDQWLTINYKLFRMFMSAAMPGADDERLRQPDVSPLYADLTELRGKLPPAIFTCGTKDILLDDTLFMSTKWLSAGGETRLEILPGAQHGFMTGLKTIPGSGAEQGKAVVDKFLAEKL